MSEETLNYNKKVKVVCEFTGLLNRALLLEYITRTNYILHSNTKLTNYLIEIIAIVHKSSPSLPLIEQNRIVLQTLYNVYDKKIDWKDLWTEETKKAIFARDQISKYITINDADLTKNLIEMEADLLSRAKDLIDMEEKNKRKLKEIKGSKTKKDKKKRKINKIAEDTNDMVDHAEIAEDTNDMVDHAEIAEDTNDISNDLLTEPIEILAETEVLGEKQCIIS